MFSFSVDFPSVTLTVADEEPAAYYTATDFLVGETIFILGRRYSRLFQII
jgi:hypothetical protein